MMNQVMDLLVIATMKSPFLGLILGLVEGFERNRALLESGFHFFGEIRSQRGFDSWMATV